MALKDTLKDPLNWVLLILAVLFGYYVTFIPYWQDRYLKTAQEMTVAEYLANPSHPRAFMFRAFGTPPSSVEVLLTDLTVVHTDADSILLEASSVELGSPPRSRGGEPSADASGNEMGGVNADAEQETPQLSLGPEQPSPRNQILIAGDNMDLLELTIGQRVELQVHGLFESELGWIPQEPDLAQDEEEMFTKEELDDLDVIKILADGNRITTPYVETGEMRFTSERYPPGEPMTLSDLADDTTYIQTATSLSATGGSVDLYGVRLTRKRFDGLQPYYEFEDAEGRRARVFYNPRALTEWYWAEDRLSDHEVVVRGTLETIAPADLRLLEEDENIQAVLNGRELMSPDGAIVISLANPSGGLGLSRDGSQPRQ